MKEQFESWLSDLEKRVKLLIHHSRSLETKLRESALRYEALELEKAKLLEKLSERDAQIEQLQKNQRSLQKNFQKSQDLIKIVGDNAKKAEQTEALRARLNEYIQQIDECIKHIRQ